MVDEPRTCPKFVDHIFVLLKRFLDHFGTETAVLEILWQFMIGSDAESTSTSKAWTVEVGEKSPLVPS